ncbi:MAG: glycosyltransferase family 2 protein [Lachnospiraceae bacterium]|nr:glycosyltransferase family 2 protein [Lachnospiraceae bacterium]
MKTIEVMLASYNGEKYIRTQLDSILKQDCEKKGVANIHITVRDDGSTDETVAIVREYVDKYPEKIRLVRGENVGVIRGFFTMLKHANTADYYAFSDQDDYWLPEKLSVAISHLDTDDVPRLYSSATRLVDSDLKEIDSAINRSDIKPSFRNAMLENVATGCTCVFNEALRAEVLYRLPVHIYMHDWWLYLVATAFGEYYYDETPYILYRQHEGNVLGNDSGRVKELTNRVKRFKGNNDKLSKQLRDFVVIYKDKYPDNECVALAKQMVTAKKSFAKRVKFVKESGVYRQRSGDNKAFKLLLLLGCY